MSASVFGPMSSPIQPDGIELMSTTLSEIEKRREVMRVTREEKKREECTGKEKIEFTSSTMI